MDETNWSSDSFYSYIFSLGFDSLLNTKKCIFSKGHHAVGHPHSDNSCFCFGSSSYINKYSKTKILAFCY